MNSKEIGEKLATTKAELAAVEAKSRALASDDPRRLELAGKIDALEGEVERLSFDLSDKTREEYAEREEDRDEEARRTRNAVYRSQVSADLDAFSRAHPSPDGKKRSISELAEEAAAVGL
jgi:hypothetical protein